MPQRYLRKILMARVYDVAVETPVQRAVKLSRRLNNALYLKREDLQPVFSFKLRGAYNKIAHLTDAQAKCGVIAASAGNHAQGVALSAQRRRLKCLIVMPRTTPPIKIAAVRDFGARIILHGDTYDEACAYAEVMAVERGMVFIHPYDDPEVIAGQGTIAVEILRQLPSPPEAIFVPVGGGGLIAGIAAYVKLVAPQVRVIGVEPEDAACMERALKQGRRVKLDQVGLFADGVAVRQVGREPFRIARRCVDEMVLVNTDEICAAIKDLFDDTRCVAEPAGALALAGMKKWVQRRKVEKQTLIAITSGANINFDRLRHVAERADLGEQREILLAVTIPEQPGSFRAFCHAIGHRSITEFNYRYADQHAAHVFAGIELREGISEKALIMKALSQHGYAVVDLSDNEMAKLHIRYMVGGRSNSSESQQEEILYRFEFPERPGALLKFLTHMGERWNISLFHYRNHGAAYGRVLVGFQVQLQDRARLRSFLDTLGYAYQDEGDNPAYAAFLR